MCDNGRFGDGTTIRSRCPESCARQDTMPSPKPPPAPPPPPPAGTVDVYANCRALAQQGGCSATAPMRFSDGTTVAQRCPQSCAWLANQPRPPPSPPSDRYTNCASLASAGHCGANFQSGEAVRVACPISCAGRAAESVSKAGEGALQPEIISPMDLAPEFKPERPVKGIA